MKHWGCRSRRRCWSRIWSRVASLRGRISGTWNTKAQSPKVKTTHRTTSGRARGASERHHCTLVTRRTAAALLIRPWLARSRARVRSSDRAHGEARLLHGASLPRAQACDISRGKPECRTAVASLAPAVVCVCVPYNVRKCAATILLAEIARA